MQPTIGRTVHFHAWRGGGPGEEQGIDTYAAIITLVHPIQSTEEPPREADPSTTVELVTFGPNSVYHNHNVPFAETPTPGHWSWPPRV